MPLRDLNLSACDEITDAVLIHLRDGGKWRERKKREMKLPRVDWGLFDMVSYLQQIIKN